MPERASLNVHFKACDTTYEQQFSRMVEDGTISLRGLKVDAKVFDELVFDVNSAYFENHGGYDYAKEFFAEAYRLAVEEVGGEEYIFSAVMHADERNKALSEQMGQDIFHYHLHVVYVPVVDKEVYFNKNNKNPELAGKLKEVVKQVSHSKKWPRFKDEDGKWVNSYSLLQDRFHEHMRAAGFTDFERGERGSTAEHLSVLDYKIQQDTVRSADLDAVIEDKTDAVAVLDKQAEKKQTQLEKVDKQLSVSKHNISTIAQLEGVAKKTIGGNIQLNPNDWKSVIELAKEGLQSRGIIKKLKDAVVSFKKEISELKARLADAEKKPSITDTMQFFDAKKRAPRRLMEVIADIILAEVEKLCDRVSIIKDGLIIESGSMEELQQFSRLIIQAECAKLVTGLELPGIYGLHVDGKKVSFSVEPSALNNAMKQLTECEAVSLHCSPPELEDLFLHYYKKGGDSK